MKAVQIIARGQPVFVDAPLPSLQPGAAIVKSLRLSLCGSDVRHLHYLPEHHYPTAIGETGHEMVGVIEAIDPAHNGASVGDRVLCLAPDHRAMCEYYLAPVDRLLPLDPNTPLEYSVQAQQFGTVLYASKTLPDLRGKTVAVIGQGSAGLWFNFALKERGAAKIIALDLKAYRLNYSKRFGATHTIHNAEGSPAAALREINGGELPDVVIEAAGEDESIRLAVEIVKKRASSSISASPASRRWTSPSLNSSGSRSPPAQMSAPSTIPITPARVRRWTISIRALSMSAA